MGVKQVFNAEYVGWAGDAFLGDDDVQNYGNHVGISANNGNDTISNYGEDVNILGENGNDYIVNGASNVTIDGGNGDDYIMTFSDIFNVSINGGFSGNDTIYCWSNNSTIEGGVTGNNEITNCGNDNIIIGSRGNDYIWNAFTGNSSVWGGSGSEGNDTFHGGDGQDIFWFGHDDGHDVFLNAGSNDVIFLYDMNVSHYADGNFDSDIMTIKFRGGSTIKVQCTETLTPTFQFSNGERYAFNRSTWYWQGA